MQAEVVRESLSRAVGSLSTSNYGDVFAGFVARGIAVEDIRPRENVFTFNAWRALGRCVRKGEHGVRIQTWVPCADRKSAAADGSEPAKRLRPRAAYVFHVSQTEPIESAPLFNVVRGEPLGVPVARVVAK